MVTSANIEVRARILLHGFTVGPLHEHYFRTFHTHSV